MKSARGRRPLLSPVGTALERMARSGSRPAEPEQELERWRRALHQLGQAASAYDLGDESVYLAEELVASAWSLGERQRLSLALVALALGAAERQGSTRLPVGGGSTGPLAALVTGLCRAAGLELETRQVLRDIARLVDPSGTAALDSLIGRPEDGRPLVAAGGAIASQRLHMCEERLLAGLAGRTGASGAPDPAAALADVDARPAAGPAGPIALSDEQRQAVALAASRPLAVVSGGPGTGKTAICAALCRVLVRTGVAPRAIALAAPTGKAAQRLTWSVAGALRALASPAEADGRLAAELPDARTLHRLLGYLPSSGRFRHHAQFPIPAEVVIVDEASMVDLELMERLVRALAPSTRLVLFGDADQLPSVEAGAVLRDLAACGEEAGFACRLARSFRMDPTDPDGRAILAAAQAVRAGRSAELLGQELAREQPAELVYRGVERIDRAPDAAGLAHLVDAWYEARIADGGRTAELARRTYRFDGGAPVDEAASDLARLAATYERSRVLAVTRRQPGGADALNILFHRRAAAALGAQGGDLMPGEPVVMRENDYARGLFNGDGGVIVRVQEAGHAPELRAVFAQPHGWLSFPVAALRSRLERAFATTVHQSQGSEHDHVAVVLPAIDIPLLSRELLYTALTRARRSVAIFGRPEILRAGVERQVRRFSGLAAGLRAS
ncbi:MAG TPA: exodeoxyribonuclease V subunit alpha [Kofleriaceae bacterium]|nr:exodeoxyribonuclease V subunit alpha [Kofleriaceae bacterium]